MAASSEDKLNNSQEIKLVIETLSALVTPPKTDIKITNIHCSILNNIKQCVDVCGFENLQKWTSYLNDYHCRYDEDEATPAWNHVCLSLGCLLHLQDITVTTNTNFLYSVSDKGIIRSVLQFISALGVLPFLELGVGVGLQRRCPALQPLTVSLKEQLPVSKWHKNLSIVIKTILKLIDNKEWDLYSDILSVLLPDIIPALVQLSWSTSLNGTHFESEAKEFQSITRCLLESIHQPTVIRELLVCMKKQQPPSPAWFVKACSKYLTLRLLSPRGVISTVRALYDLGSTSDDKSQEYGSTARLLTGLHITNTKKYYLHLCPQLLELLSSANTDYQNVAVHTIQRIWSSNAAICQEQILQPLWSPLQATKFGDLEGNLVLENKQEEQLFSLTNILLALTSPAGMPIDVILPVLEDICQLHLAIRHKGGTPRLRTRVEDLLTKVMSTTESDEAWKLFLQVPEQCLLDLATDIATANALFLNLLNVLHKTECLEQRLMICKLLISTAEIPSVQRECLKKPNAILINTIKSFIEDPDSEMVPIALLLLGTMIAECEEWTQYQCLIPALQKLRKSITLTESLRAVAEEILSTVATFGSVVPKLANESVACKPTISNMSKDTSKHKTAGQSSTLEDTLKEINDSDIPVQGHGYLSLTKIIQKKDTTILTSLDQVFDVCINGIKHEDSYVYLAAIGALSALILISLDPLLVKTCTYYSNNENGPTLRTRLGESLLQVCKSLGEMAGKYRPILLNTFLAGAKDASPAIRSSSLSNLGTACKTLGFQVSSQLQEILLCAHSLATSDPEIEVRRAAILLVSLLLSGLGKELVPTLGSSALELYRSMKQLAISEDSVLSLQAQLALDELSHGIKEGLFTPQPLEKKIHITSPPP